MRSANPALNNNTFRNTRRVSGEQAMSIDGTVNKTALSLLLVMTSAIYTWNNPELGLALFWPVTIFTFILLMIQNMKMHYGTYFLEQIIFMKLSRRHVK